jgi:hypothetical protein
MKSSFGARRYTAIGLTLNAKRTTLDASLQIIETAPPGDFFDRPRSARLRAFLGPALLH